MNEKEKESMQNIAHQWRQPLSQINSVVSVIDRILYKKNIHDKEIEEKLQEIEKLTQYMSHTIDDFSSEIASTKKKKTISLAMIIMEALSNIQMSLKEDEIILNLEIDQDSFYECYSKELMQIIIVLVNNARDALLERNTFKAKIDVSLYQNRSEYKIQIADNAGGITKNSMEKIFLPNYSTKHSSDGSGIGLFMAKKIIEEHHNGSLTVQNKDEGTLFCISLPKVLDNANV